MLALCLLFLPRLAPVIALASSVSSAWVLGEVRTLAWYGKLPELAGEPWGVDAWSVLVGGAGVLAFSAVAPGVAWPAAWMLAALLAVLGVRALAR